MGAAAVARPDAIATGWEQQREVVVVLKAGGTLRWLYGALYELAVPAGIRINVLQERGRTTIIVTKTTVRALVAKGLIRPTENGGYILTSKGKQTDTARQARAFTKQPES